MRKQEIRVEQRHIDAGERRHSGLCPVALALREATGFDLSVNPLQVSIYDDKGYLVLNSPLNECPDGLRAAEFIRKFDNGESVRPFSFYLLNLLDTIGEIE